MCDMFDKEMHKLSTLYKSYLTNETMVKQQIKKILTIKGLKWRFLTDILTWTFLKEYGYEFID